MSNGSISAVQNRPTEQKLLQECDGVLWKEMLNSDGQQFHQYQENEHLLFILTS